MELTSLMKVDNFLLRTPLLGGRNEKGNEEMFFGQGGPWVVRPLNALSVVSIYVPISCRLRVKNGFDSMLHVERNMLKPSVCDLKFFAISHWWHEMSCSSLVLVKGSCLHVVH